jgi:hypothetical protein
LQKSRTGFITSFREKIAERSPLRHPGLAQAVDHALAPREMGWIVAHRAGAKAVDGEGRVESEARLCCGLCLTHPAKMRPGDGEIEMREGKISIGLDGPE